MLTEGWSWTTSVITLCGACVAAIGLSRVMAWTSDRSALWSMVFGGIFVFLTVVGAVVIALLLTNAAFG